MNRRFALPTLQHSTGRRFRLLLPLMMSGLHVCLLVGSLLVRREPWVVPPPQGLHAQDQAECSGENCAVTFSPAPELRTGRILKAAELLSLPAVFLGAILHLVAVLIHLPHASGERALLGFSTVFVPLIWYRIGRWVDLQARVGESSTPHANSVWTLVTRTITLFFFALLLLSFIVERHRESDETKFVMATAILWTGTYLGVGLVGDRRRAARSSLPVG